MEALLRDFDKLVSKFSLTNNANKYLLVKEYVKRYINMTSENGNLYWEGA